MRKIKNIIDKIENSKGPLIFYIVSFFFIVQIRNLLETFVSSDSFLGVDEYVMFNFFYFSLALTLIFFLTIIIRDIVKACKIILTGFSIIVIPPIIDFFVGLTGVNTGQYIYVFSSTGNVVNRFFMLLFDSSLSLGIRIEIFIVVFLIFIYLWYKKGIIVSIIASLWFYTIIFIFGNTPLIMTSLGEISRDMIATSKLYLFWLLVMVILLIWYRYPLIIKDTRLLRVAHFELFFIFGVFVSFIISPLDTLFMVFAIYFAILFSIIINNLADYDIDKISNKTRPTFFINHREYLYLSALFILLSVICSLIVSPIALLLTLVFIGLYFIYSSYPIRFKRVPILSKGIITANTFVVFLMGYSGFQKIVLPSFFNENILLIGFIVLFFTLSVNFIDIKDYKGDKKENIKTLPVIMGLSNSKFVIGLWMLLTYTLFGLLFGGILIPLSVITGITQFFLVTRKKYREKPVLTLYILSLVVMIFYVISTL